MVFPVTLGLRYFPFESRVRPLLGVDLGGYFGVDRAPAVGSQGAASERSRGSEWTWSMRALAGAQLTLSSHVALRVYADAQWSEQPENPRLRGLFGAALGAGCELSMAFSAPRLGLLEMLLRGTGAPAGW